MVVLLLAEDRRRRGRPSAEQLAQQALGAAVGLGDRRVVGLVLDGELDGAEVGEGEIAGPPGEVDRLLEQRRVAGRQRRTRTGIVRRTRSGGDRRVRRPVFFNPLDPDYLADPYPHLAELREARPGPREPAGHLGAVPVRRRVRPPAQPHHLGRGRQHHGGLNEMRGAMFADLLEEFGGRRAGPGRPGHPQPRPARPHPHPQAGVQGVHRPPGRAAPAARPGSGRRRPRPGRRRRDLGRGRGAGLPPALPGDQRAAGHARGRPGRDPGLVPRHHQDPRPDRRRGGHAGRLRGQRRDDRPTSTRSSPWKREHPADDVLTGLVQAEEDGDTLSADELRDQIVLLFIAGHETTVNLIGNGMQALLRHPDQMARWRDDPGLDATAVDELPALRRAGAAVPAHRHERARARRADHRPGHPGHDAPGRRPTGTRPSGARPPTSSTSAGPTPAST